MLLIPERAGPHDPVTTTPRRAENSRRRTTNVDTLRPAGLRGPVAVDGRARDLLSTVGEVPHVAGVQHLSALVDQNNHRILHIAADPPEPRLAGLVGATVGGGFRAKVTALLPDHAAAHSLLNALVDDLPGALLVAGYAQQRGGVLPRTPAQTEERVEGAVDICAGWAREATMVATFSHQGEIPVALGPSAPLLERPDDEWSWHAMGPLAPHAMRRRRRLDLCPGDGTSWKVEAHFRDSHVDEVDAETVLHEYLLDGRMDALSLHIEAMRAEARVLPWMECPAAVASTNRLVGGPVGDLRSRVRVDFVGVSTCTHLNDTFRSLADLEALLDARA